jgi:hypothetical protein
MNAQDSLEREKLVWENPGLVEQIRQGLAEAEAGTTVDRGSFAQFLPKDEHDDVDCADSNAEYPQGEIACYGGTVYGFCESEYCNGLCEPQGSCPCVCHQLDQP